MNSYDNIQSDELADCEHYHSMNAFHKAEAKAERDAEGASGMAMDLTALVPFLHQILMQSRQTKTSSKNETLEQYQQDHMNP